MRRIILIAHESRRKDLMEWVRSRRTDLSTLALVTDGGTGLDIASRTGLPVDPLPEGNGDAIAAAGKMIEEGLADLLVFFWKPAVPDCSGEDAEGLLRLADLHELPTALNPWTADFFLSSMRRGARKAVVPGPGGSSRRRAGLRVPCL